MFPEQKICTYSSHPGISREILNPSGKSIHFGVLVQSSKQRGEQEGKAAIQKTSKERQVALTTHCISKILCPIEDFAVNHFSLGEPAFTDYHFFSSEVLTGFC